MTSTVRRDAMARNLQSQLGDIGWSEDELAVIGEVMSGLRRGREVYGPLDVESDHRDFSNEARAELRDTLVYLAAHQIATSLHLRRERILASETNGATPATTQPSSGPASRISPVVRSTPAKARPEGTASSAVATARRATQPSIPAPAGGHQDRNFFDGEDDDELAVPLEPPPHIERIPAKRFDTSDVVPKVLIDFEQLEEP